jgi:hypothetical protein
VLVGALGEVARLPRRRGDVASRHRDAHPREIQDAELVDADGGRRL